MTTAPLPRVFRYNSVELEDPGLEHDPIEVRNLYAATYPEITSAAIEGPDVKDGKRVYTFRKAVGTKGLDESIGDRPCRHHVWTLNSGRGGEPEFRPNRTLSPEPLMHVQCSLCSTRTWFTQLQWEALTSHAKG